MRPGEKARRACTALLSVALAGTLAAPGTLAWAASDPEQGDVGAVTTRTAATLQVGEVADGEAGTAGAGPAAGASVPRGVQVAGGKEAAADATAGDAETPDAAEASPQTEGDAAAQDATSAPAVAGPQALRAPAAARHTVTFVGGDNYAWRSESRSVADGDYYNNTIRNVPEGYYIESVVVEPAGAATVSFSTTSNRGANVLVDGVTADCTISAVVRKVPATPYTIAVTRSVAEPRNQADFDVETTAVVTYTATVTDKDDNPVPGQMVAFSVTGAGDGSTYDTRNRATGTDGTATFTTTRGVGDYTVSFSTDGAEEPVTQRLHVVAQGRPVIDETLVRGVSAQGASDGSIGGLDETEEWFDYPINNPWSGPGTDALVYGEGGGTWRKVSGTSVEGLEAGVYAIRHGQRVDGDTVYLFSPWARAVVNVATYTVTVRGEHVQVAEGSQTAQQNGTVYFHVTPDDGWALGSDGISVDYPGYYGSVSYDAETGLLTLTNVTRNHQIQLTATQAAVGGSEEPGGGDEQPGDRGAGDQQPGDQGGDGQGDDGERGGGDEQPGDQGDDDQQPGGEDGGQQPGANTLQPEGGTPAAQAATGARPAPQAEAPQAPKPASAAALPLTADASPTASVPLAGGLAALVSAAAAWLHARRDEA